MRSPASLTLIAASLMTAPALAAEPAASERRLSPQQIEAVLAEAAKKREAAEARAQPGSAEQKPPRPIHGEVGMSIGTGGYREAYGTGVYPLGDDGAAAISLDYVDLGRRRVRR